MRIIDSKKKKGLCVACRCTNPPQKRDRFCAKHSKRYQKLNNPISYTFNYIKENARRRGKEFSLTLEEFTQFCEDNDYIRLKGTSKKSATIDRIDNTKGYSIDNIQVLSLSSNSSKQDKEVPF